MKRMITRAGLLVVALFATTVVAYAVPITAAIMSIGLTGASSPTIQVDTSPGFSRHWHTVFTNEVPLYLDWSAGATRAELEITGMNGSFTTNLTEIAPSVLWRAFTSNSPATEDVYDLTVTFYNNSDVAVNALTSRLAVVTAAFGHTVVIPGPASNVWSSLRNNVVLPYDAGWSEETAGALISQLVIAKSGGATQTYALADAAGFFGWKIKGSDWGYGTFNLALTFPGTAAEAWDATLVRVPEGMIILVR